jgi:hypothetical protein
MKSTLFQYTLVANGVELRLIETIKGLFKRQQTNPIRQAEWLSKNELHAISGLAYLDGLSDSSSDSTYRLADDSGYFISHPAVAGLTDAQAKSLGLPATVPYMLRLSLNGPLLDATTRVSPTWHKASGVRITLQETGAIISDGANEYRLPASLYSVLDICDRFNEWDGESLDGRLALSSELKLKLESLLGIKVDVDKQLDSLNLMHASTVSLDVTVSASGVDFSPALFQRRGMSSATDDDSSVDGLDAISAIPEDLKEAFAREFKATEHTKPTYVLGRNQYVFIDPSLREAIKVIRNAQKLPAEDRARFAKSPQSFIKQHLQDLGFTDEQADELVSASFIETASFSERVTEIGLWQPPVFPFIQRQANSWLPESFGLKIGTKTFKLAENKIKEVALAVAEAAVNGPSTVLIDDTQDPLPATLEVLDALNAILKAIGEQEIQPNDGADPEPLPAPPPGGTVPNEPQGNGKSILQVQNNFLDESFTATFAQRCPTQPVNLHPALINTPKPHQVEGIHWLQTCWSEGFPGVLLADDMGLGKTFQVLAFMLWLRAQRASLDMANQPVLIVAPTSLLGNWEQEAKLHVSEGHLPAPLLLYAGNVKRLRTAGATSNDVIAGKQTLDTDEIRHADWVLTTYETMRDYHLTLASVRFSCIVFDEMQKIKSPSSMMTSAAQALNSDFQIGMTGTPIENSLADIWTLFDTLMPGGLNWGSLNTFVAEHTLENPDKLKELKVSLQVGANGKSAPMLRRMKTDVAKDLPPKVEAIVDIDMGEAQALHYLKAVRTGKNAVFGEDKMAAFHQIRGISLHPFYPDSEEAQNGDDYVNMSARLKATMAILDKLHANGEKALIFIESIAMHAWLAFYLQHRYSMGHKPHRIYGAVSAAERSNIVREFQDPKRAGQFDLLLLSPKAAGVGLTLTAANHVIHLSRWWNPAVEDQCTDRTYRIGQTKSVTVHIPRAIHPAYGHGSFDCVLHDLLERKRSLSRDMLIPMDVGNEIDEIYKGLNDE